LYILCCQRSCALLAFIVDRTTFPVRERERERVVVVVVVVLNRGIALNLN
jgi:hypothetical protein